MDNLNNVKKIINKIAFYKDKMINIENFESLPFTTKKELLKSQELFPPYGNFFNPDILVEQIYRTSGTTSKPLLLCFSKYDIEYITDIGAQCYKFSGMGNIGNKEIVINCLNLSMWAGGFFDAQAMMKTGVQVINFGTGNTNELIKLVLDLIKDFKVSLHCTPSYLPVLEKRLKSEFSLDSKSLHLWKLYLGAESGVQDNDFRNFLMKNWNCEVFNSNYGMSEVCSIFASANEKNILRFAPMLFDFYYLELHKDDGHIIDIRNSKKGDIGELVISSIIKQSQPLIRYSTKEKIKVLESKDEIFFEVLGRTDDMLVVKGINFFPEQLRNIIIEFEELTGLYKLEVHKNHNNIISDINLICELRNNLNQDNAKLREQLQYKIKNELTIKLDINFSYKLTIGENKIQLVNFIKDI